MTQLKEEKVKPLSYLINRIQEKEDQYNIPKFCFLLGAGCSVTSNIPTGGGVIEILKMHSFIQSHEKGYELIGKDLSLREFLKEAKVFVDNHKDEFAQYILDKEKYFETKVTSAVLEQRKPLNCQLGKDELEAKIKYDLLYGNWFEEFSEDPRTRQKLIESIISQQELHGDYIILANLIQQGLIHNIFTTNFDDLINESLLTYVNLKPRVYSHNELARYIAIGSDRPNIIKLHGDYLFENIKNISDETHSLEQNMRLKFKEALNYLGLVVVGYGGTDHSIMNVIESIKEERPFSMLWVGRDKNNIHWRVIDLINNTKNSFFVEVADFTTLMIKLWNINKNIDNTLVEKAEERQQKLNQYLEEFNKSLGANNNVTASEKEAFDVSRKVFEIHKKFLKEKDSKKRLDIIDKGLAIDPKNANLINNKGTTYYDLSNYEQAIKCYSEAIKIDTTNDIFYSNRAQAIFYYLNDYEQAFEDLKKAIELNPKGVRAYHVKGEIQVKLGDNEKGFENFNKAIQLEPFNPNSHNAIGLAYGEVGKFKEALESYDKSIKYGIENKYSVYNNMAVTYRRQKNIPLAKEYLDKAIKEKPDFGNSYGTYALLYADQNNEAKFYEYVEIAMEKGCPIWFYLDDKSFNKYRNQKKLTDLINKYKKS